MKQRVLMVYKRSTWERLQAEDIDALAAAGVLDRERLYQAHLRHQESIATAQTLLAGLLEARCWVGDLRPEHIQHADLVLAVGGDGTVFGVQRFLKDQPVLALNSDPHHSVGHYTRIQVQQLAASIEAWRQGRLCCQDLPRLAVDLRPSLSATAVSTYLLLNDALLTNRNPAEMTRYRIEDGSEQELQYSSGIWVATAAGSSAAIASSGLQHPCSPEESALLYRAREIFRPRPARLESGIQAPARGISLTTALPGMELYIDGAHSPLALPAGAQLCFRPHHQALRLLLPPSQIS